MSAKLQMSLIENALDYLDEAVERLLKNPDKPSRNIKYAVLHLHSAVELILKQVVMDKHKDGWEAIAKKTDEYEKTKENFVAGRLQTISGHKAIQILTEQLKVTIDEEHSEAIERLRSERNRVEHFDVHLTLYATHSLLLRTWSFVVEFVRDYIDLSAHDVEELYDDIKAKIFSIERFVEQRIQEVQPDLVRFEVEESKLLIHCPECGMKALPLGEEYMVCVYCETDFMSETLVNKWLHENVWKYMRLKDRIFENPVSECPYCGNESLFVNRSKDDTIPADFFCFSCGNFWMFGELDECTICGELFEVSQYSPHMMICRSCLMDKINNSD